MHVKNVINKKVDKLTSLFSKLTTESCIIKNQVFRQVSITSPAYTNDKSNLSDRATKFDRCQIIGQETDTSSKQSN